MASVPRSQDKQYSQRSTTAPMNDMPVEVVMDNDDPGGTKSSYMGSVVLQREGQV